MRVVTKPLWCYIPIISFKYIWWLWALASAAEYQIWCKYCLDLNQLDYFMTQAATFLPIPQLNSREHFLKTYHHHRWKRSQNWTTKYKYLCKISYYLCQCLATFICFILFTFIKKNSSAESKSKRNQTSSQFYPLMCLIW